jgi:hypothetical protein
MKQLNSGISAEGRTPPPPENRFLKGRSGNPAGRPKGSVSLSAITRKVALKMHTVPIEGKPCRVTLLELLILKTKAMAASGQPGAARLINWLRSQTELCEADLVQGAFAIVPETMAAEEFLAKEEMRTAHTLEPGTFVDVRAEEFLKAARGQPSPLGQALLAFHKKYGAGPAL